MEQVATLTMNPALDVSAEVEELIPGPKLRSPWRQYEPGGGGINVARVIHRFGGQVCAVYPAGGPVGDMLDTLLRDEGVDHVGVPIRNLSRESFAVHVSASDELYHFVMPGPELSREEADHCIDALADLPSPPAYIVASGSLPEGVDDEFYARIARLCRDRDMRLILDTSGEPLHAALKEELFLVKPNEREFAQLAGEDIADDEADRREQARGVLERTRAQVMIVTMGDRGALLTSRDGQIRQRPPRVDVVSPVGAGDSFVALLAHKLAVGRDLEEALRYGVAAAAAAVTTPGSELCRGEDVERLYGQLDDTQTQSTSTT